MLTTRFQVSRFNVAFSSGSEMIKRKRPTRGDKRGHFGYFSTPTICWNVDLMLRQQITWLALILASLFSVLTSTNRVEDKNQIKLAVINDGNLTSAVPLGKGEHLDFGGDGYRPEVSSFGLTTFGESSQVKDGLPTLGGAGGRTRGETVSATAMWGRWYRSGGGKKEEEERRKKRWKRGVDRRGLRNLCGGNASCLLVLMMGCLGKP